MLCELIHEPVASDRQSGAAHHNWDDLARELDMWQREGHVAELWWRDDDATAATPALDRLLAIQRRHHLPLMLAVIPARAERSLVNKVGRDFQVTVVQHGWAHDNHAWPGQAFTELGSQRSASYVLGELTRGALALDQLFGADWLRVLVPPFNRVASDVVHGLSRAGYAGLSAFGLRRAGSDGLVHVNAHLDIMNWRTRRFLGESLCLDLLSAHLADKRVGRADPTEPSGLLTHHLTQDEDAWQFLDLFLERFGHHPAIVWRDARDLFRAPVDDAAGSGRT